MTKNEFLKEYQEAIRTEKIHNHSFDGSADTDNYSGLSEVDIENYDGRKEVADYVGDRTQFMIDRISDDGGAQSAYKRMLQRQHDYKGRGREMQKQLAVDNHSAKGDHKK